MLAAIVCGGTVDWAHAGDDDLDCSPVLVLHDRSAHRYSTPPSQSRQSSEHCYICHSLRLLHIALAVRGERVMIALQSTRVGRIDGLAASNPFCLTLSSRAPPALSL